MSLEQTETLHAKSIGLDQLPKTAIAQALCEGQIAAAEAVKSALSDITDAVEPLANRMRDGQSLAYSAAGSSAMMAMSDGLELPGTFGIEYERIKILTPGGIANDRPLIGATEDDMELAEQDFTAANLTSNDTLIALSASGATPYVVKMVELAKAKGLLTIALANNSDAKILKMADKGIYLPTQPEIIAGSTRMGAGTSQKIALNLLSTLTAINLGHVYDGMMVNLVADNEKLKQRATRIIATITGCSQEDGHKYLTMASGSVKPAILIALGTDNIEKANQLLEKHRGNLRKAMADLKNEDSQS